MVSINHIRVDTQLNYMNIIMFALSKLIGY